MTPPKSHSTARITGGDSTMGAGRSTIVGPRLHRGTTISDATMTTTKSTPRTWWSSTAPTSRPKAAPCRACAQLNDAVMAFREEYPDAVVTVVVDATFGHRIDKKEAAEFDAGRRPQRARRPAGRRHRPRRRLRAEHRQQGRRPHPQQRLVPGVPRRLPVAVRRGPADRRQAGAVRRLGVRRAAAGEGPGEPQVAARGAQRRPTEPKPVRRSASKEASQPMPVPTAPPPGVARRGSAASRDRAGRAAPRRRRRRRRRGRSTTLLPFLDFVEHHPVGSSVNGVVESYSSHGAYVTHRRRARLRAAAADGRPAAAQRPRGDEDRRRRHARRHQLRPGPAQRRPRRARTWRRGAEVVADARARRARRGGRAGRAEAGEAGGQEGASRERKAAATQAAGEEGSRAGRRAGEAGGEREEGRRPRRPPRKKAAAKKAAGQEGRRRRRRRPAKKAAGREPGGATKKAAAPKPSSGRRPRRTATRQAGVGASGDGDRRSDAVMRFATWNVNSLKVRQERVEQWLADVAPDIVCMQETKLADERLPAAGVRGARLRRRPPRRGPLERRRDPVARGPRRRVVRLRRRRRAGRRGPADDGDVRRHHDRQRVRAQRPGARRRPLRSTSSAGSTGWPPTSTPSPRRATPVIVAGDFNIAPTDADVYDPAAFVGATHVSEPERDAARRADRPRARPTCSATSIPTPRRCSRGGTTAPATSTRAGACASTSCSPRRRSPSASSGASSTATPARASCRATTPRSSSTSRLTI